LAWGCRWRGWSEAVEGRRGKVESPRERFFGAPYQVKEPLGRGASLKGLGKKNILSQQNNDMLVLDLGGQTNRANGPRIVGGRKKGLTVFCQLKKKINPLRSEKGEIKSEGIKVSKPKEKSSWKSSYSK